MFKRYLFRNYRVYTAITHWIRQRVTRAGGLVLGTLVFAGAQGDASMSLTYQAFCFLFFLALAALLTSRLGRVRLTAQRIVEQSPILAELVQSGRLKVAPALYDLASGRVTFLD